MVLVLEALEGPHKVELVGILLAESRQDGDFDLALASVRRMIFEDFDGNDVAGALFPALDHLTEGAAAKELENLGKEEKNRSN